LVDVLQVGNQLNSFFKGIGDYLYSLLTILTINTEIFQLNFCYLTLQDRVKVWRCLYLCLLLLNLTDPWLSSFQLKKPAG